MVLRGQLRGRVGSRRNLIQQTGCFVKSEAARFSFALQVFAAWNVKGFLSSYLLFGLEWRTVKIRKPLDWFVHKSADLLVNHCLQKSRSRSSARTLSSSSRAEKRGARSKQNREMGRVALNGVNEDNRGKAVTWKDPQL
jgi:hypothetical protein